MKRMKHCITWVLIAAMLTGALAGCSPAATTPVDTQPPAEDAPPAPDTAAPADNSTPSDAAAPQSADVVIVGGGAAGLTAAITAARSGASVILLEKLAFVGGSSIMSAGAATRASKDGDPEGSYTADMLYQHWLDTSQSHADTALLRKIADMSAETVDWLVELGVPMYAARTTYFGKALILDTAEVVGDGRLGSGGPIMVGKLEETAVAEGVQILFETPATSLLTDASGAVTGVEATLADGSTQQFNAGAVILASGGFTANTELLASFNMIAPSIVVIGGAGNTGDAIEMATAIGADTIYPETNEIRNGCYGGVDPSFSIYQSGMAVDANGQRFMDESGFYGRVFLEMRDTIAAGTEKIYQLYDQNNFAAECEAAVTAGYAVKADTLAELAAQIGVDAAALEETAARYTENKGSADPDFGKDAQFMLGLSEGPFYAMEYYPMALGTFGGLYIDTEARIMKADGSFIPNLYGAGECASGSFFYDEYPYSGTCIQFALSTGRIAGANAAA